ncbi:MAG: DUF6152 family protein [Pseudomonadales bacterium]|nr:DUF6152 family protein [Pseudomonadales bacterium]
MLKRFLPVLCSFVPALLTSTAYSHHSFAPHFDVAKPVSITGTVTVFEKRNPHAYLHIEAPDANGRTREYVCESHGVTQLTRNGITPEMLAPGTVLTLKGSQHRRDPYACFFNSIQLADGRVLDVNGPRASPDARPQFAPRTSLYGTWLLQPIANRSTSGPQEMMNYLTAEGAAAVRAYQPFVDDPAYRCDPVAVRRAWFAPGTPMAIRQAGEDIIVQHEWMDIQRTIHMGVKEVPATVPPSSLGYSMGHFEGETLVIETLNYAQGVLNQYVEMDGFPTRGLLHSDALRTLERIRFNPDTQRVEMSIEHVDPKFFTRDFPLAEARYGPTNLEIQTFGCIPEILK